MNDLTITMTIPVDASCQEWLETGRHLARMKNNLGFMVGDWVNHGRKHFPEQLDLLIEDAGFDPVYSMKAARIAEKFPSHTRSTELSFDHHRAVHMLPAPEQMELLHKAGSEHWNIKDLREAVVQRRYENGSLFDDEDVDTALAVQVIRAWNRATPAAREYFFDLAKLSDLKVIDEDKVGADEEA